jgi:hypothetical protein
MGIGGFAVYTVWAKPQHPYSSESFDQAFGVPRIVTRILRGALGLLFVGFGIIGLLRVFKILAE